MYSELVNKSMNCVGKNQYKWQREILIFLAKFRMDRNDISLVLIVDCNNNACILYAITVYKRNTFLLASIDSISVTLSRNNHENPYRSIYHRRVFPPFAQSISPRIYSSLDKYRSQVILIN